MTEIEDLIRRLGGIITDVRTRGNTALAGLPPIDQIEGAQEFSRVLSYARYAQQELDELGTVLGNLKTKFPEVQAAFAAKLEADCAQKLLAENAHVLASDHEAQISLAKKQGKEEAESAYQTQLAQAEARQARRAEANTALGAGMADHLSDDVLDDADWNAALTTLKDRSTRLASIGLDPEIGAFGELLGQPVNEDGKKIFETRLAGYEKFATKLAAQPATPGDPPRTVPPGQQPAAPTETNKALLIA